MQAGNHILIVEDDATITLLLSDILNDHGYTVQIAGDGLTALAMIREQIPSLVLLDIGLPKMSGIELVAQLELEGLGDIPIVVMTANQVARSLLEHKRAYAHLDKPFHIHELLQRINQFRRPQS